MFGASTELIIVLLLILINGLFSMSELAVMSSRRVRLQRQAEAGDASARAALALRDAPDRFLSTVQIGITLVGILSGAFGGATISRSLGAFLKTIPALAPYSEPIAVGAVVLVITYLSLVLGELVPKQVALSAPERIAAAIARPMGALSRLAGPIVGLLTISTRAVVGLLRVRPASEPPVTEEEITLMLAQGAEAGVFEEAEQDLVENVFRLADRRVVELMTPRYALVALDVDAPLEENRRKMAQSGHWYFPVFEESLDNILGVVSIRDLWARSVMGEPDDLRSALFQPLFVPESMRASRLLEEFRRTGQPIALVVDEYGAVEGLMTLGDVVEELIGEVAEPDEAEPPIVERDDGSWLIEGALPLNEFRERFPGVELPSDLGGYQTLAGLVLRQLGHVPRAGEHFDLSGMRFEVIDMDGQRIDKVLVRPVPASSDSV